jgi:hypothetical protein
MPEKPIPPIAEINRNPDFTAEEISKSEFEAIWDMAHRSTTKHRA